MAPVGGRININKFFKTALDFLFSSLSYPSVSDTTVELYRR
jgi:hypothetical protein